MTEHIITLLNQRLLTTGYFKPDNLFGLCEIIEKDKVVRPLQYCGKGDFKNVSDFDQYNGSAYWRKIGPITSQDIDSTSLVASNKMVRLTIPLRVVATCLREKMIIDGPYNAQVFGNSLLKVLNKNLNGNTRQLIGARSITLTLNSLDDNNETIMNTEFKGGQKRLSEKLVIVALNFLIIVDIRQDCIGSECELLDPCEALLTALSTAQKNECILPDYDFSDPNVLSNLTVEQEAALIEALCESGEFVYDVYVNGVDTGQDVTVDGTDITINLN